MANWNPIPGFEGFYSASDEGDIRNDRTGRYLSMRINSNGYHGVLLSNGLRKLQTTAHRVIAYAFLGIPDAKLVVNHKDGDKLNNRLSNLEWVTQSENSFHASKTGLRPRMKHLSSGCRHSEIVVTPSNWNTSRASTSVNWRIYYRFYDPRFTHPKQVAIASGINRIKDLKQRQHAVRALIEQETTLLDSGYNPFDGNMPDYKNDLSMSAPSRRLPFCEAIEFGAGKVQAVKGTMIDIRSVVRGTLKAAKALNIDSIPISDVSRRHIKQILEYLRETNPRFSNHRFNKYRAYLSRVFRELIEMELIDSNPVRDIAKAKETFSMRETLSADELAKLAELKTIAPAFYRYIAIFFYSGSRTTELFRLKYEDVDLSKQEFRVLVKKGNSYREDIRVVTDDALEHWNELMETGKAGMYVFSRGLRPGRDQIRPDQINRRWNKYVIQGLGVKKDFYSLKHTFADMIAAKLDINHAATLDGHTTPVITLKHYAPGERARERERIKKSGIRFGSNTV